MLSTLGHVIPSFLLFVSRKKFKLSPVGEVAEVLLCVNTISFPGFPLAESSESRTFRPLVEWTRTLGTRLVQGCLRSRVITWFNKFNELIRPWVKTEHIVFWSCWINHSDSVNISLTLIVCGLRKSWLSLQTCQKVYMSSFVVSVIFVFSLAPCVMFCRYQNRLARCVFFKPSFKLRALVTLSRPFFS